MDANFDYVIVGAGSAGCVIACRLVEAGYKVALIEEGPTDKHMFVKMPGAFIRLIGTERTYLYTGEPQQELAGRSPIVPQGRMLGGSSSVNAMVYIRGQPQDYDDWAAAGATGWRWQDVLPAFLRAEANEILAGPLHGKDTVNSTALQGFGFHTLGLPVLQDQPPDPGSGQHPQIGPTQNRGQIGGRGRTALAIKGGRLVKPDTRLLGPVEVARQRQTCLLRCLDKGR